MTQPVILNPHESPLPPPDAVLRGPRRVRYAVVAQTEDGAISDVLWVVRGDTAGSKNA